MDYQERQFVADIIKRVKDQDEKILVSLEEVGAVVFRNAYNEASMAGLTLTIIERCKVFQISK